MSSLLSRESREALLQISREDAAALRLCPGEKIRLSSRRGAIELRTEITEEVQPGTVYTTFHFPEAPINALTVDAKDPKSKCPEYKVCAVNIERVAP